MQREVYDRTGKVHLSVEEQLRQTFGHGTGLHKWPSTYSLPDSLLILQATSETQVLLHKQGTQLYQSKLLCGSLR